MQKFNELVKDQFQYGGKKYALSNERESTDVLFEVFGAEWLYGTMAKYCYRFKNLSRERDLLKVACYCYILWLKRGYFLSRRGMEKDIIDTTVELKTTYFDKFITLATKYEIKESQDRFIDVSLDKVVEILKDFRYMWTRVYESSLLQIYYICYTLWKMNYEKADVHDTDTTNTK